MSSYAMNDALTALTEARETIRRLNRRCQSAEAGLVAKMESGPCFGRALANASATMYREQNVELRALLERFYCAYVEMWGGDALGVLMDDVERAVGEGWKRHRIDAEEPDSFPSLVSTPPGGEG